MRSYFLAAAACLTLLAAVVAQADAPPPMNVVLLLSDDQRWDSLGAAGNPAIVTPHLDQLAGEGVRFTRAYVTTSICMTSRATILSGQYMSRHGIDRFGKSLAPDAFADTYPAVLRRGGYWTGFVGKYGVGPVRQDDFDFVRAYEGRHWMQRDGEPVHVTQLNRRDSLEFLRERPRDQPFLLSVSFFAPHAEDRAAQQYLPQPWSEPLYRDVQVPRSPLMDAAYLRALPPFLAAEANEGRVRFHWRFDTPSRYQQFMTHYYRLITEVDQVVGDLIEELKQQGVYDNTLIVFTGDNGYFHGERGLADKWYPYEQAIRVPLIVRDPRLPTAQRGQTRDHVALNLDLAPTIMAAAGLAIPAAVQGSDLAPLYLASSPPAWREEFFYEHPTITRRERIPSCQGVIGRDYKYIHWPEWDHEQLFDRHRDPTEKVNLADDPQAGDTLRLMRGKLDAWRAQVK